jgi:hypothetical protein
VFSVYAGFGSTPRWRTVKAAAEISSAAPPAMAAAVPASTPDASTAVSGPKHWHVFHVIAAKR